MSFVGGLSWAEKHDTDVILRLRQSALSSAGKINLSASAFQQLPN